MGESANGSAGPSGMGLGSPTGSNMVSVSPPVLPSLPSPPLAFLQQFLTLEFPGLRVLEHSRSQSIVASGNFTPHLFFRGSRPPRYLHVGDRYRR